MKKEEIGKSLIIARGILDAFRRIEEVHKDFLKKDREKDDLKELFYSEFTKLRKEKEKLNNSNKPTDKIDMEIEKWLAARYFINANNALFNTDLIEKDLSFLNQFYVNAEKRIGYDTPDLLYHLAMCEVRIAKIVNKLRNIIDKYNEIPEIYKKELDVNDELILKMKDQDIKFYKSVLDKSSEALESIQKTISYYNSINNTSKSNRKN